MSRSRTLRAWPGVTDTRLQLGGRRVRVLRADEEGRDGGEPQLLVHGLGGSSVTWVEVMEGLAEYGPVVAVDLPGFGRTPVAPTDRLTVGSYVRFVLELADQLGWERFTLHGNSMGGLVSTLLAARHRERVQRLVLVSPALPPRSPARLLLPSRATMDGMLPILSSSVTATALGVVGLAGPDLHQRRNRAMLQLIFPDPDSVNRELLHLMAADFAAGGDLDAAQRRRAMLTALRSIARHWTDPRHAWRAVGAVEAPTLVLGGTADALVPAAVLRAVLARRPDWTGRVLDDRRHALMMEDPGAYLQEVARWRKETVQAA